MQNNIDRESLYVDLETRYYGTPRLGGDAGNAKDIASNANSVNGDAPRTNFINGTAVGVPGEDVHNKNFKLFARLYEDNFTPRAQNYSVEKLRVPRGQKYTDPGFFPKFYNNR